MRAAGYTAVGEFHYLGVAEALAARGGRRRPRESSSCSCTSPTRAAGCPASGRSRSPHTWPRSRRSAGRGATRRLSLPTPSAHARPTGSRRSPTTPPPRRCRCTCTPTSSRARSRSAWRSTAAARSSCSPAPAASASGRPSSMRRTRTVPSSICSPPRRNRMRLPDHRGRPRRRLPSCRAHAARARFPLCIGSDSNVRIDPLEELRELEGIARRQTGRRGVFSTPRAAPLRLRAGRPRARPRDVAGIEIDLAHRSLAGVDARRRSRARSSRAAERTSSRAPRMIDGAAALTLRGRHRADLRAGRDRAIAGDARDRRLLGRVVRAVPRARARARCTRSSGATATSSSPRWTSTRTRGSRRRSASRASRP